MRFNAPPDAGTVKISLLPNLSEIKAIVLLSLDHTGSDSNDFAVVSCLAAPPLDGTTKISPL